MTISEEAVKAMPERIYAVKRTEGSNCVVSFDTPSLDYNVEYVRADLAPFLPVQGSVKTGERLPEAEKEITRYQQERHRWINYTVDLQRIIEALCDRRGLPEPISTARHHYDMAREYLSSRAGNAARILSALEPSVCKTCNGHGIIGCMYRVGDGDVDGWEKPCPECEPSPRAQSSELSRRLEEFLKENEDCFFDCEIQTVKDAIRALSSPDHADAGKVEGDGWMPTHRHKKRGTHYSLIGIGKMQADNWQVSREGFDQSIDMEEVSIYRSVDDGSLWVRPREEFEDGRFETLPTNPSGGDRHGE